MKPLLCSLLALAAIGMLASGPATAQVSIALRPTVQVVQDRVNLGDIADLSAPDAATLQRFMSLSLGSAPLPGKSVSLSGLQVQGWAHRQLGPAARQVQWSGASRIEIVRAGPAVTRGSFAAMVWRSAGIEIETRVEVLQDGQPGQQVRVRTLSAPASIMARVLEPGRVEGLER